MHTNLISQALGLRSLRGALAAVIVTTMLVLTAGAAGAHVTVNPAEATKGGYAKLTFRVPNESDTAATTQLRIVFPDDITLSMRTRPPAWVDCDCGDARRSSSQGDHLDRGAHRTR